MVGGYGHLIWEIKDLAVRSLSFSWSPDSLLHKVMCSWLSRDTQCTIYYTPLGSLTDCHGLYPLQGSFCIVNTLVQICSIIPYNS